MMKSIVTFKRLVVFTLALIYSQNAFGGYAKITVDTPSLPYIDIDRLQFRSQYASEKFAPNAKNLISHINSKQDPAMLTKLTDKLCEQIEANMSGATLEELEAAQNLFGLAKVTDIFADTSKQKYSQTLDKVNTRSGEEAKKVVTETKKQLETIKKQIAEAEKEKNSKKLTELNKQSEQLEQTLTETKKIEQDTLSGKKPGIFTRLSRATFGKVWEKLRGPNPNATKTIDSTGKTGFFAKLLGKNKTSNPTQIQTPKPAPKLDPKKVETTVLFSKMPEVTTKLNAITDKTCNSNLCKELGNPKLYDNKNRNIYINNLKNNIEILKEAYELKKSLSVFDKKEQKAFNAALRKAENLFKLQFDGKYSRPTFFMSNIEEEVQTGLDQLVENLKLDTNKADEKAILDGIKWLKDSNNRNPKAIVKEQATTPKNGLIKNLLKTVQDFSDQRYIHDGVVSSEPTTGVTVTTGEKNGKPVVTEVRNTVKQEPVVKEQATTLKPETVKSNKWKIAGYIAGISAVTLGTLISGAMMFANATK